MGAIPLDVSTNESPLAVGAPRILQSIAVVDDRRCSHKKSVAGSIAPTSSPMHGRVERVVCASYTESSRREPHYVQVRSLRHV